MTTRHEKDKASEPTSIRTFVCVELPKQITDHLERAQQKLRQTKADVGWVKVANIHLTLKFLGGVAEPRLEGVRSVVEQAARQCSAFEIEVGGLGCFPSLRRPRVVWAGIHEIPSELETLQRNIETGLTREGFAQETRPFKPHLTLGRVRSERGLKQLVHLLEEESLQSVSFRVSDVTVMRSDLKPSGAIYTPQARFHFGPEGTLRAAGN